MVDETKHVQMNEAMWDKWAEDDTLDNNGQLVQSFASRSKQSYFSFEYSAECSSSRHRLRNWLGGWSSREFGGR